MSSSEGLRELFFAFVDEDGSSHLVRAFDWQLDIEKTPAFLYVELKQTSSNREEYVLQKAQYSERVSDLFQSGQSYQLEVQRIFRKTEKTYVVALDVHRNQYKIFVKNWESRSLGVGDKVWCEISYLNTDIDAVQFELAQILQYPFFQFARRYHFTILDQGEPNDRCTLKDDFGCLHSVKMSEHLRRHLLLAEGGETHLYYLGVLPNHDLNLRFFRSFQDIIPFKSLRKKVFDPILHLVDKENRDTRVYQIKKEYKEFRNYWVLTFGQYLIDELPRYYDNGNLADARLYAEVAFLLEQWILKSGYQYSIDDDEVREKIVEKTEERIAVLQNWLETIEYIQENEEIEFIFNVIDKKHVSVDRSFKLLKILRFYIGRDRLAELETEEIYEKLYDALGPSKFKILYPEIQVVLKKHMEHLIKSIKLDVPVLTTYERRSKYIANSNLRDLLRIQFHTFRFACNDNEDTAIIEFIRFLNFVSSYSSEPGRRIKSLNLAIQLSKGDRQLWKSVLKEIVNHDFDVFESSVFDLIAEKSWPTAEKNFSTGEILHLPRLEVNKIVLNGNLSEYYFFFDSREIRNGWYGSLKSRVIASDPVNRVVSLVHEKAEEPEKSENELVVGDFYDAVVLKVQDDQLLVRVNGRNGIIEKDDLSTVQVADLSMVFCVGETLKVKLKQIRFEGEDLQYLFDRKAHFEKMARFTDVQGKVFEATLCSVSNKIGLFLEAIGLPRILLRRDSIDHRSIHLSKLFKVGDKIPIVVTEIDETGCLAELSARNNLSSIVDNCKEEEAVLIDLFTREKELETQQTYCSNCMASQQQLNLISSESDWNCQVCQTVPRAFALMHVPSLNKFIFHPLNSQQEYRSLIDKVYNSERLPVNCQSYENDFWCIVSMDKLSLTLGSSQYSLLGSIYENAAFETSLGKKRKSLLKMSRFFYELSDHKKKDFVEFYSTFVEWVEVFLKTTKNYKVKTVERLKAEVFLAGRQYIKSLHERKEIIEAFPNLTFLSEVACAIQDWDLEVKFSLSNNLASAFLSFYLLPRNFRSDAYQLEIIGVIREALIEFVGLQFGTNSAMNH